MTFWHVGNSCILFYFLFLPTTENLNVSVTHEDFDAFFKHLQRPVGLTEWLQKVGAVPKILPNRENESLIGAT